MVAIQLVLCRTLFCRRAAHLDAFNAGKFVVKFPTSTESGKLLVWTSPCPVSRRLSGSQRARRTKALGVGRSAHPPAQHSFWVCVRLVCCTRSAQVRLEVQCRHCCLGAVPQSRPDVALDGHRTAWRDKAICTSDLLEVDTFLFLEIVRNLLWRFFANTQCVANVVSSNKYRLIIWFQENEH